MSDHEFEKQVQLKMEQLKLRPSSAVWAGVEKNIRRDKHRRRMIIWLPILLLLLGGGGYFAMQPSTRHAQPQDLVKQETASSSSKSSPVNQNTEPSNPSSTQTPDHTNPSTTTDNKQPAASEPAEAPTTDRPAATPAVKAPAPVKTKTTTAPAVDKDDRQKYTAPRKVKKVPAGNLAYQQPPPPKKKKDSEKPARVIAGVESQPDPGTNTNIDSVRKDDIAIKDDSQQPSTDTSAMVASPTPVDSSLAQVSLADSLAKDTAAAVAAKPAAPAPLANNSKDKKTKQPSKWQFGVQAEGGASGVTKDGLFGFLENSNTPVADLASPSFGNVNNALQYAPQFPRPVNKASNITMGPAFSIGGFAQYAFSKRLSLSAGLQYSYLSTRQVVGNKVNNNRTVNRAPSTAQVVESYYSGDNSHAYSNKYHFLELPVTLHTQLNKGIRLPIIWDVGFAVSKLLNTSAVHYDGIGGVYYKDNALFNKTQWVVSSGFNVKLLAQSKHPLTVGPVMRYNMTPLLKKDFSTGQHLWSVGLRATVLLKK